jgi:polar amino acid transport system substrate-binding protein
MVRLPKLAALAVAGVLILAACGGDDSGSSSDTTAAAGGGSSSSEACGEIKVDPISGFTPVKADTLTVVTSLPGPGFFNGDTPETINSGYEYCLALAMQQAYGLKDLVIRNESFDSIVTGAVKDYDVALSQITITDERAKVVDFSEPYFESQQGILVKKGTDITTLEEAKKAVWGVQSGTTGEILVRDKLKPDTEAQGFQDLAAGFAALSAGQVEAFAMDTAIVLGQAASSNGTLEVTAQFAQEGGPDKYGALFPKGSTNIEAVNALLEQARSSGLLSQFQEKNLTKDPGTLPTITIP